MVLFMTYDVPERTSINLYTFDQAEDIVKETIINEVDQNELKLPYERDDRSQHRTRHIIDMTIQSIGYSRSHSMNSLRSSSESMKSIVVDGIKPEKFVPSKFDIAIGKLESSNKNAIEVEEVSNNRP